MDTTQGQGEDQGQNLTPDPTQDPPPPPPQDARQGASEDSPQAAEWALTRYATSRGYGAQLPEYLPGGPANAVQIGAPFRVPVAEGGGEDKPPGDWARYIWKAPFSVARQGDLLKGHLAELLKSEPVRELIPRERYFTSARRMDELLRNNVANVESAAVYCQGEIQTDEDRCRDYSVGMEVADKLNPNCVRLANGEGSLQACANCMWNGMHERCSFWKPSPTTPSTGNWGHQRNKPSVSKKAADAAWKELNHGLDTIQQLPTRGAQACADEDWSVVDALVDKQGNHWKTIQHALSIVSQFHSPKPSLPQQPEGN
ncbi:uncharacterized protein N7496_008237 [Penicillium cataractarum]|uniref:Uncharacterized protein n=1 Tax=Penicillium cataractarum TaxID=2100454 RepID=A0A9W9RY81_9EURO|nr:uncharacterized protein N7496_008237 [Penicillium cataractarum]KAJ5368477.1 hypothetical protein N7496_008237 [Penicillium cataractarum]